MKHKLIVKYFFISTLLVAAALWLLGLPLGGVNAGPPEPTPSPAIDIRTKLQPYQTPGAEPSQSDGRTFEEAPLPSEVGEPPIDALAQQTFYAVADSIVLQGYPSQNLGRTRDMWAGYDEFLEPDGRIARSLVKFNITSLPSNATITQATLRVYLVNSWDFPNTSRTIRTYRITSSWSESGVTWNNKPGYGESHGSRSIRHGAWGWYGFDVTNLAKAWHKGMYANYGIMLRGPEVSGYNASWRGFGTREGSYRPQLVVEYTTNTPPTISGLPDQTLQANTSLENAIDLWAYTSDAESPDSGLTFTIDNAPNPDAGVSIDSNRYIDINPAPGWTGQTDVTIRVRDPGGLSDTDSFSVLVSPGSTTTTTIYLPLIIKSPPPPPDGHWTGITSRGYPMSFDVSGGGATWSNFKLKTDFSFPGCSGTVEVTIPGPGTITNNQFNGSGSGGAFSFSGQLTSLTTASGTYAFVNDFIPGCGNFSQSGAWTANRP